MHDAEPPVTNNSQTDTDLPLLPGGNNGNGSAAPNADPEPNPWDLLREAGWSLPEPPSEVLDTGAVLDWVERASAALLFRRDRQRLLREAMGILDDDWNTAMATNRLRAQLDRQQARLEAKAAGTYWRDRDGHRRANQPTHVRVDRDAWDRAKITAVAQWTSVGVLVGELVTAEVRRPCQRDWHRTALGIGDR